ncbi:dipeptidase [Streptococcus zalophi]|uniref:C69 family dipeptidase n=1 Tax=Streptococcus zalophi TaxID=640031 RepID=A0A934P8W2_9STRE|nr:C69 family dipeptidase [Streptococcus zalophi]MBJ8349107.1 C69 family dipeptidase [Streptococcus zalophi]MCR8967742.1 C69 family dipeptidase [Streptococcus zalophi]
MLCFVFFSFTMTVDACTGFIVGSDLTEDGKAYFGRTEDLEVNHNKVYQVHEAGEYKAGDKIVDVSTSEDGGYEYVMEKDSNQFTSVSDTTPEYGIFDEAGFNDKGLVVDMTVSASYRDEIDAVDPYVEKGVTEAVLPTVVLASADTADQAVELIANEVATKGASEGNDLVVADHDDTWYMEIYSGHQFVAMRYPKDKFSVMPNTFWLNEVTLDIGEEFDNYIISKNGQFLYSKGIFDVAKKAGTFKGDEAKRVIDLAGSYAPEKLVESNRSRVYSGIKHLNPDANVTLEDQYYNFLQDAPEKSISLQDLMALTRNRMDHIGLVADELGDPSLYPIGNRNTMEAHIFQLDHEKMTDTYPGVMWLAMGSPLVSPYVPYYPNQTTGIAAIQNQTNEFSEDSMYWIAMDILHMVETNRDEFMKIVNDKLTPAEQEIMNQAVLDGPQTSEAATANNNELAEKAFATMKEIREELMVAHAKYLAENDYVTKYRANRRTRAFAGSTITVEKGTSDKKILLSINGGGQITATDVYGNDLPALNKELTYSIAKAAIDNPIFYDDQNNIIAYDLVNDFYVFKTKSTHVTFKEAVEYKIIEGANQTWQSEQTTGLTIVSDGDLAKFLNLTIDGQVVDANNYELSDGSTKLTLKADYLKTLATNEDKEHDITLNFNDGKASTKLTVTKLSNNQTPPSTKDEESKDTKKDNQTTKETTQTPKEKASNQKGLPKTGDETNTVVAGTLLALSSLALYGYGRKKREEELQ